MPLVTITAVGSGTFDWDSLGTVASAIVECVSAGWSGDDAAGTRSGTPGTGGPSGAYATKAYTNPSGTVNYGIPGINVVGEGDEGTCWFDGTGQPDALVSASNPVDYTQGGGFLTGDSGHDGNVGGAAGLSDSLQLYGGGGAGAGGPNATGGAGGAGALGGSSAGGTGGTGGGSPAGNGGDGARLGDLAGQPGSNYGAGGGGGLTGGAGAGAVIIVTYTLAASAHSPIQKRLIGGM